MRCEQRGHQTYSQKNAMRPILGFSYDLQSCVQHKVSSTEELLCWCQSSDLIRPREIFLKGVSLTTYVESTATINCKKGGSKNLHEMWCCGHQHHAVSSPLGFLLPPKGSIQPWLLHQTGHWILMLPISAVMPHGPLHLPVGREECTTCLKLISYITSRTNKERDLAIFSFLHISGGFHCTYFISLPLPVPPRDILYYLLVAFAGSS